MVKTVRQGLDPNTMKEGQRETVYSGFKEVGGIKYPTKMAIYQEGKKFMELEISETKLVEKIDDSEFDKP